MAIERSTDAVTEQHDLQLVQAVLGVIFPAEHDPLMRCAMARHASREVC